MKKDLGQIWKAKLSLFILCSYVFDILVFVRFMYLLFRSL